MFNVQPPANICSEEPTQDITFGVDNPTYVALATISAPPQQEMSVADDEEDGHHYEVIEESENKPTVETKDVANEDKLPLANISHEELQEIDVAASENVSVDEGQTSCGNIVTNETDETLDIFDDILNKPETADSDEMKDDENIDGIDFSHENSKSEEEKSENLLDF